MKPVEKNPREILDCPFPNPDTLRLEARSHFPKGEGAIRANYAMPSGWTIVAEEAKDGHGGAGVPEGRRQRTKGGDSSRWHLGEQPPNFLAEPHDEVLSGEG